MSVCDGCQTDNQSYTALYQPTQGVFLPVTSQRTEKKRGILNYHFKVINLHCAALNAVPSDQTHLAFYRDDIISVHPVPINGCTILESQMAGDPRRPRARGQDADAWKVVVSSQG